jgi:hypothetical protein
VQLTFNGTDFLCVVKSAHFGDFGQCLTALNNIPNIRIPKSDERLFDYSSDKFNKYAPNVAAARRRQTDAPQPQSYYSAYADGGSSSNNKKRSSEARSQSPPKRQSPPRHHTQPDVKIAEFGTLQNTYPPVIFKLDEEHLRTQLDADGRDKFIGFIDSLAQEFPQQQRELSRTFDPESNSSFSASVHFIVQNLARYCRSRHDFVHKLREAYPSIKQATN